MLFGAAGFFTSRLFNLSTLSAVLWTLGGFGLAGGASLACLLQSAGNGVRRTQYVLLAVTWALCCVGGAFPLFFTMGTRPEMAIRTFYSFAAFGAMGGAVTTGVLRSIFEHHADKDSIPGILIWSFSFGLAAVAGDIAEEWLRPLLPSPLAWPVAIIIMTGIIGSGSGWAILQFFKSDRGGRRALQIATRAGTSLAGNQKWRSFWILIILCSPFYLNDLSNIFVKDWRLWLLIDYTGAKLFPLLVMLYLIRNRILRPAAFIGLQRPSAVSCLSVVVIAVLSALFIEQNGPLLLKRFFRDLPLGSIPTIPDPLWKWIDLSAGLLLVGALEEAVFRGYFFSFLRQYTCRSSIFIVISAVAFGFIHWSGGLHQIILTAAVGAVFMLLYLRTYSLPAIIMSHFIVNFIDYAGIIPPALFCFFPAPPIR